MLGCAGDVEFYRRKCQMCVRRLSTPSTAMTTCFRRARQVGLPTSIRHKVRASFQRGTFTLCRKVGKLVNEAYLGFLATPHDMQKRESFDKFRAGRGAGKLPEQQAKHISTSLTELLLIGQYFSTKWWISWTHASTGF